MEEGVGTIVRAQEVHWPGCAPEQLTTASRGRPGVRHNVATRLDQGGRIVKRRHLRHVTIDPVAPFSSGRPVQSRRGIPVEMQLDHVDLVEARSQPAEESFDAPVGVTPREQRGEVRKERIQDVDVCRTGDTPAAVRSGTAEKRLGLDSASRSELLHDGREFESIDDVVFLEQHRVHVRFGEVGMKSIRQH
jgi:hypothetical protein